MIYKPYVCIMELQVSECVLIHTKFCIDIVYMDPEEDQPCTPISDVHKVGSKANTIKLTVLLSFRPKFFLYIYDTSESTKDSRTSYA